MALPNVANGIWTLERNPLELYAAGTQASLTCAAGYTLSSLSNNEVLYVTCTDGAWVGSDNAACISAGMPAQLPQPPPPFGFGAWLDAHTDCPLTELRQRALSVDNACCSEQNGADAVTCDNHAPTTCNPVCGSQVASIVTTCNQTANVLFDALHSGFDGTASDLDKAYARCRRIPPAEVLSSIKEKEAEGCTVYMAGLAETAVPEGNAECADTAQICSLIGKGYLTCPADFCPGCAHAHECDLSCGFCGRRRAQISLPCPIGEFESRVDTVQTACCLDAGDCDSGAPDTCDALCASTFLPFCKRTRLTQITAIFC